MGWLDHQSLIAVISLLSYFNVAHEFAEKPMGVYAEMPGGLLRYALELIRKIISASGEC